MQTEFCEQNTRSLTDLVLRNGNQHFYEVKLIKTSVLHSKLFKIGPFGSYTFPDMVFAQLKNVSMRLYCIFASTVLRSKPGICLHAKNVLELQSPI